MDFFLFPDTFFQGSFVLGTFVFLSAATYGGILLALPLLEKHGCYAVLNASSNHTGKIPHGAGLVVVVVVIAALFGAKLFNLFLPPGLDEIALYRFADMRNTALSLTFFTILSVLCLCSFSDDIEPKSVVYRLSLQVIAAIFVITLIPGEVLLGYAPYALDKLFALLFVITFANFVNFMDGCDGMCGVQVVAICTGLVALGLVAADAHVNAAVGFPALVLGASMAGFLLLNWPPARIFLGDAGSIPIGFFLAVLLLLTSSLGYWEVAVLLPLYFYCDAGITLLKRVFRREKFWLPHKRHFYKIALQNGRSHRQVVSAVALVNVCIVGLAMYAVQKGSLSHKLAMIAVAALLVAVLLFWMTRKTETKYL